MNNERKYLPTLGELIDRLSIVQLKEVFIKEHATEYAQEIQDIIHDINIILAENDVSTITGDTIRAIIVVAQMNLHIWHNESNCRMGTDGHNDLRLTHAINGERNMAKNKIQECIGGRQDHKIDCLAAGPSKYHPSWGNDNEHS